MTTNEPTPTGAAGAAEQLAPPAGAPAAELTLTAPGPVAAVAQTAAGTMVPIDQAALPGLDKMVGDYVDSIVTLDVHSPEFARRPRASARWATTTSAPRRASATACSTHRCGR